MTRSALKKSVEEIILGLPRPEQIVVKRLRQLIQECLPKAEERNSYGVPFYRRHRMICFIWPPSIRWGPKSDNEERIVLGFCQGNKMANEDGVLLAEGRKQVYCMYLKSIREMDENRIRALLFEAGMIDEGFGKKARRKQTG
jgi:hypothetical protein